MRQDRINALESEVVAYETDLERAEDELLELHTTLDGYKIKIDIYIGPAGENRQARATF